MIANRMLPSLVILPVQATSMPPEVTEIHRSIPGEEIWGSQSVERPMRFDKDVDQRPALRAGKIGPFEKRREKMYILWAMIPQFPEFKPIEIGDRDFMQKRLWEYQPETSELNFTNLFIWRNHYGLRWSTFGRCILIVGENSGTGSPRCLR